ncbi:MAG: family 10 glycosylhydrolase [Dysgonamonadaceae bacterium]|jgi:uncharacterized lipoprotein YddW (UPF0748 family)|nr:family 10 glycosylhydrolase [Dysgonamonadaceae bacterium]
MKQIIVTISLAVMFCMNISAQHKREIRAVWLTVNHNLDWPDTPAVSKQGIEKQKTALDNMLDRLKEANINMVFFQVRIRGSVTYSSAIEPFSELIKSRRCTEDFDALGYAIEGCHRRGMELHAWFVVYPLGKNPGNNSLRSISVKFKNEWYINPGNPGTTPYLVNLVRELVEKYDIDGIHFDYIRYPDGSAKFPDDREFKLYGNGKTKDQWRRGNINRFVYEAYDAVKALKPWVIVSSAVVGMYNTLAEVNRKHWTAYNSVFQDPVDWITKGKHDFIVPMLYSKDNLFFPFIDDWVERCGRERVVPGLGIYMISDASWSPDIITGQVRYLRDNKLPGCAFFRVRNLTDDAGFYKLVTSGYFPDPALLPAVEVSRQAPCTPGSFRVWGSGGSMNLSWDRFSDADDIFYNVYCSESFPVDTDNPKNLIVARLDDTECKLNVSHCNHGLYYCTVTAYDRYHNESMISETALFVVGEYEK